MLTKVVSSSSQELAVKILSDNSCWKHVFIQSWAHNCNYVGSQILLVNWLNAWNFVWKFWHFFGNNDALLEIIITLILHQVVKNIWLAINLIRNFEQNSKPHVAAAAADMEDCMENCWNNIYLPKFDLLCFEGGGSAHGFSDSDYIFNLLCWWYGIYCVDLSKINTFRPLSPAPHIVGQFSTHFTFWLNKHCFCNSGLYIFPSTVSRDPGK